MDVNDDFDESLLQEGESLTSLYLSSLPPNEAQALISSIPASEQARRCDNS